MVDRKKLLQFDEFKDVQTEDEEDPSIESELPKPVIEADRAARRARLAADLTEAPQTVGSETVERIPEEEQEYRAARSDVSAVTDFATAAIELHPAMGPESDQPFTDALEPFVGMGEFLFQTALATAGATVGTIKATADVIGRNISEETKSINEGAREEIKQRLSVERDRLGNPLNVPEIDPADLPVVEQYVNDKVQINRLSRGDLFVKSFKDVAHAPLFSYTPQTDSGLAISETIGAGFAKFEEWGSYAGDAVFDATGNPTLATMAETTIAGIPYVVPLYFGRLSRKSQERQIRKERYAREKEAQADPIAPDLDRPTVPGRMSPEQIIKRVNNFPDQNMILNRGQYKDVSDVISRYKGTAQQRPVILSRNKDGTLSIVEGEVKVFARSKVKNSRRRPLEVEIVEEFDSPRGFSPKAAEKMDKLFEETELARETANKRPIIEAFQRETFDQNQPVVKALESAGDAGKIAIMDFRLTAGGTVRGKLKFQGWEERIYSGLDATQSKTLDNIIFNERVRQIDQIHGIGKIKHPNNVTAIEATDNLRALQARLGDAEYARLQSRARDYFKASRQQLDELYVEGIISKELWGKLKNDVYEPRKLIKRLDRSTEFQVRGGDPITVTDSGIKQLSKGSERLLETDSRRLLAEYIIRVQNRIMRNQANKSLAVVGSQKDSPLKDTIRVPEVVERDANGFAKKVKVTDSRGRTKTRDIKPPEGFIRVDFWERGEQQPIFLEADFARAWTGSNHAISAGTAEIFRKLSASFILKPLATGYNPGFAVVNFPRDIMHIYLASNQYSILPSKYTFQIARDLAATAKDAWKKDGQFLDYINEGGGMDFLTHQGQGGPVLGIGGETVGQAVTRRSVATRHWKEAASKINEFSEIWTRLALRRRAIRNGASGREATFEARSYLDFSQGGTTVKAADSAFPYLNAATQAFRTGIVDNLKKGRRGRFSAKVLMLNEPVVAFAAYNWMINPEGYKQVAEKTRHENFILMLPPAFDYTDPRTGEEKSRFLRLRKDNVMVPMTFLTQALMEKYLFDLTPEKSTGETAMMLAGSSLPVVPDQLGIPTLEALKTYNANYDQYWDDNIWHGQEVLPSDEVRDLPRKPTSPIARELAPVFGLSPERAEAAARKILPHNDYLDAALYGVEKAMEGMRTDEKRRTIAQWLQRAPMLNRLIDETHPMATRQEAIERAIQSSNSKSANLNREVDRQFFEWKNGNITRNEFMDWVQSKSDVSEKRQAMKRWETNRALERVFTRPGNEPGVGGLPGRSWWLALSNIDPEARAQAFYEEWRSQDLENRRRMERIARHLSGTNNPFWDGNGRAFMEFERMKSQRGEDVR